MVSFKRAQLCIKEDKNQSLGKLKGYGQVLSKKSASETGSTFLHLIEQIN
jgi:hypothetical protein